MANLLVIISIGYAKVYLIYLIRRCFEGHLEALKKVPGLDRGGYQGARGSA